ncbi:hypothetical protein, partial [Streptomyces sp. NPDC057052]|uniref:hypothetical protein n=1 Tax=Streptomyces sp. NPDC057052 TaxID=3346010 RepID=UPI0036323A8B
GPGPAGPAVPVLPYRGHRRPAPDSCGRQVRGPPVDIDRVFAVGALVRARAEEWTGEDDRNVTGRVRRATTSSRPGHISFNPW